MTIHAGFFAAVIYENGETGSSFPVSWPRVDNAHVQVLLNGIELLLDTDYTSDNVGITLSGVPLAISDTLVISRLTPRDTRRIDWGDGVPFVSKALDAEGVNIHYIQQELADQISMAEPGQVASTFEKYAVAVTAGMQVLQVPAEFRSLTLLIDGVIQFETDAAYTFDGTLQTVTLAEPLQGNEVVEVWLNAVFLGPSSGAGTDNTLVGLYDTEASYVGKAGHTLRVRSTELGVEYADTLGEYATPHTFTTCFDFVANLPYTNITNGSWITVTGRTIEDDGNGAKYQVTDVSPTDAKGIRFNYENYIPLDTVDPVDATLWAVLREGFKRDFREQSVEIIAHRSFNFAGVQNTSFNDGLAMNYNVQALETDVQVTSDGELVRYHDTLVDSDTDGTGAISDLTLTQVKALNIDIVPTLYKSRIKIGMFDEFVAFAKSVGVRIYPEIKQYRTIADIQLMVDVIEKYQYESMTIMQSFLIDDLVEVRRINKRVGVGWLTTNIGSAQQYADFDTLSKLKYSDVLIQEGIIKSFPALVDLIYNAGVGCAAWGLEDNTEMNDVFKVGVFRHMIDQPILSTATKGIVNVNY
jgi:glycerophosphoryl diester phosphodiesterase